MEGFPPGVRPFSLNLRPDREDPLGRRLRGFPRKRIAPQEHSMLNEKSLRRALFAAPLFAVVTATASLGTGFFGTTQVASTIDDFFVPGSQPNTLIENVFPSVTCSGCHGNYDFDAEPYRRWVSSMMGQAGRDPIFYACLAIANQDAADAGDLCLRCHTPGAWLAGRSVPTDGSALDPVEGDLDGVTCHLCHRMVDPIFDAMENPAVDASILAGLTSIETNPHSGSYILDPNDRRRGPFDLGPSFFWHAWEESPFHRDSALCGTCHDVSNPLYERSGSDYLLGTLATANPDSDKFEQFPVERTYSEWTASDYSQRPVEVGSRFGGNKDTVQSCQDCHMPDTTGTACAPALNGETRTDLPLHNFNGANSWVLGSIFSLYPTESGLDQTLVDSALSRTYNMMGNATDMDIFERNGRLVVRIVNQSGHKFPTGYIEGRRSWINVRFFDAGDNLISQNGKYDYSTATLTTSDTKVYESKHGVSAAVSMMTGIPQGESFHFAVNNTIEKDNRIPPRGFTNGGFAAIQAEPVGEAYGEEVYWDDTEYQIPPGAVKAHVFHNHQTTTKEYIEFLRDENTTNSDGMTAYNQWQLHGRSAPLGIDRGLIEFASANCATPVEYGLSKETSMATLPRLSADDLPSVASGSLTLRVTDAIPNTFCVLIMGSDTDSTSWNGGKRYVSNPITRLGGFMTDGSGEATFVLPLTAAMEDTNMNFQVVFRDTMSTFGLGLTNGLAVDVCE